VPDTERESSRYRTRSRAAVISAGLFLASAIAWAASVETSLGAQTFTAPVTGVDSLALIGLLDSGGSRVLDSTSSPLVPAPSASFSRQARQPGLRLSLR